MISSTQSHKSVKRCRNGSSEKDIVKQEDVSLITNNNECLFVIFIFSNYFQI